MNWGNKYTCHKFLIVSDQNVCLLGRDLCSKLNIKLHLPIKNVKSLRSEVEIKYRDYLSDSFKSCVTETVKLPMKVDANPVFCKSRSVPLRYRTLLEEELKRLEQLNVISKVISSDWSSPIVSVLKDNNKIMRNLW